MEQPIVLTWHQFSDNLLQAADLMRTGQNFTDVTLAAEDMQIEAHRFILATGSIFFQKLLNKNETRNSLIYLFGVKFTDLVAILDFLYCGQVQLEQSRIEDFLSVAEELGIKGLAENASSESSIATVSLSEHNPQTPSLSEHNLFPEYNLLTNSQSDGILPSLRQSERNHPTASKSENNFATPSQSEDSLSTSSHLEQNPATSSKSEGSLSTLSQSVDNLSAPSQSETYGIKRRLLKSSATNLKRTTKSISVKSDKQLKKSPSSDKQKHMANMELMQPISFEFSNTEIQGSSSEANSTPQSMYVRKSGDSAVPFVEVCDVSEFKVEVVVKANPETGDEAVLKNKVEAAGDDKEVKTQEQAPATIPREFSMVEIPMELIDLQTKSSSDPSILYRTEEFEDYSDSPLEDFLPSPAPMDLELHGRETPPLLRGDYEYRRRRAQKRKERKPRSTATKPYSQPRSTATKPLSHPRSAAAKPLSQPRSAAAKPLSQPRSAVAKPLSQPRSAAAKPSSQPRSAAAKPSSQPRSTKPSMSSTSSQPPLKRRRTVPLKFRAEQQHPPEERRLDPAWTRAGKPPIVDKSDKSKKTVENVTSSNTKDTNALTHIGAGNAGVISAEAVEVQGWAQLDVNQGIGESPAKQEVKRYPTESWAEKEQVVEQLVPREGGGEGYRGDGGDKGDRGRTSSRREKERGEKGYWDREYEGETRG